MCDSVVYIYDTGKIQQELFSNLFTHMCNDTTIIIQGIVLLCYNDAFYTNSIYIYSCIDVAHFITAFGGVCMVFPKLNVRTGGVPKEYYINKDKITLPKIWSHAHNDIGLNYIHSLHAFHIIAMCVYGNSIAEFILHAGLPLQSLNCLLSLKMVTNYLK